MKLDPRTIPYRLVSNGLRVAGIAIFSVVSSGGTDVFGFLPFLGLLLFGLFVLVGWEYIRFQRIDYELTPDTFDVRSGVLSRREREIPFHRVQNVDIEQNVVHRLLGIAEVRLETAGGGSTEAQLQFVSRGEADRLQNVISDRKRGDTPEATDEPTPEETIFELTDREHLILGLVSADFRFLGALSVLLPVVIPQIVGAIDQTTRLLLVLGPAVALLALVAFWLLSGFLQILRYYGFTLTRREGELRYERGLLQRYSGTVPLSKVQTVTLQENVLARTLGYASLVIQTAGYAPGQDGSQVESAVPIARRERAVALAREVEPVGDVSYTRPPKRARTRYAARYALALFAVTGLLWLADSVTGWFPLWYAPLVALVVVPVAAHLKWRHLGYYVDDDYVITRRGFWRRQTVVVPYDRVQTVFSSQTIFQRRRHLGTVTVDTAGGGGIASGDAVALDIDAGTADQLREDVADSLQRALTAGRTHSASP